MLLGPIALIIDDAVHNLMYGIATMSLQLWVVGMYLGLILSNFASLFFAVATIADDAIGPVFFQSIYKSTIHTLVSGTVRHL
mmetsp:Transcript_14175/g.15844  ORF Transcript_14175/g.15844 Transcript_14175/m.15844 type:complete len:82 (-) Transcript_14175:127-372(-)